MHRKLPRDVPRSWLCYGVLGSHALTDDLSESERGGQATGAWKMII